MKIAVCMKQVPAYSEGNMDKKTGMLLRTGLLAVTNPGDEPALEAALQIKESIGGEVTVFTMGPAKAEQVIREAFARGADRGYLICDPAFGGADVVITAYTLMQAIKSTGEYDLILCGRQSTDGDTAQVGGALAKWFSIPNYAGVTRIEEAEGKWPVIRQQFEDFSVTLQAELPCLLSVEDRIAVPRMPSLKLKMEAGKKKLTVLTREALEDKEVSHYGLTGSATKVRRIFAPEPAEHRQMISCKGKEAAEKIISILQNMKQRQEDG